ncbi:MAG: glucosamine-6-phosphate deaminase [Vicinamibacteria bacterium]|nr:glucosamine-6-phosphate deaminase [Vicinamibacteria bacterium]
MKLEVFADPDAVARAAAELLTAVVAAQPEIVLALPTGRTPVPTYAELARRHGAGAFDPSRARAFNLDELLLPRGDERTFRAFMERHAWERIGLVRERCDIPDSSAADPEAECRRYEQAIAAAGGIDLALLGVGADGHVAYNLPGPEVERTHVVTLPEGLADSLGVSPDQRPLRAITMGLATIRSARRIVILATGASKARPLQELRSGAASAAWPCTFLRDHTDLTVLADRAAAGD